MALLSPDADRSAQLDHTTDPGNFDTRGTRVARIELAALSNAVLVASSSSLVFLSSSSSSSREWASDRARREVERVAGIFASCNLLAVVRYRSLAAFSAS